MELKDYFESTKGIGVMATADTLWKMAPWRSLCEIA